ncbi:MAG: hypothetical protein ACRCYQ_16965, partial [Nocardioides sp.]
VHCTKAMIASWWASPAEVLRQVSKAHAVGVGGISAVRLTGLQARALAQLGRKDEAAKALKSAHVQREKLADEDDLRELGEIFTFSRARQHYYNATTHLRLGNWGEVERETASVGRLYESPAADRVWPVTSVISRIYRARAALREHGVEGAADVVRPVLETPIGQRVPQVGRALDGLREDIAAKPYVAMPAARELVDSIRSFQLGAQAS